MHPPRVLDLASRVARLESSFPAMFTLPSYDAGGSALTQQERGSRRMSIPTVGEPSAAEGTGQQDVARGHEEQPARCGWWPTFVERTRGCRRACDVRLTASPRAAISADTLVFCT